MSGQAETFKSMNVNEETFAKMASSFGLPFSSLEECVNSPDAVKILLSRLSEEHDKNVLLDNTINNLEKQNEAKDKIITGLRDQRDTLQNAINENAKANTEITKKWKKAQNELTWLRKTNTELLRQNKHQSEVIIKLQQLHFGVKSEKIDDLLNFIENNDPLDENSNSGEGTGDKGDNGNKGNKGSSGQRGSKGSKGSKGNGKKGKGKLKKDLANLPHQNLYQIDIDKFNKEYGEGNWSIVFWRQHKRIECVRTITYWKIVNTPVIVHGPDRHMVTIPYEDEFVQHSHFGPSLLANMMCESASLYIPTYRMEFDWTKYGVRFSRQTIQDMMNSCALNFFMPVYNRMQRRLAGYRWHQCDETTWQIILNEKGKGKKSYFWVHRSSELDHENPQIILYQIELSRGEEHLEKFFADQIIKGDIRIYLSSDAYSAYKMLARLYPEIFINCFCLTHCRRRFVDALNVLKKAMSNQNIEHTMEWLIVELFSKIYAEEAALKDMSAEERLKGRKENIAYLMAEFFKILKGLDLSDPSWSDTMKDAVTYALNHEDELCQFLTDGTIPIDNNGCERSVKNIAIARKNSMFSYSLDGATAKGIIFTMVRTAIANGADPYFYLLYLLTNMSKKYYNGTAEKDLDTMMPWSDEYRQYEKEKREELINRVAPPSDGKPVLPRKSKTKAKQPADKQPSNTNIIYSKNMHFGSFRSMRIIPPRPICI